MPTIVSSRPGRTLLAAVQHVLDGADEALLAVAFVDTRGIHLLEQEMKTVGSLRLLATSQFDRNSQRTDTALARAVGLGAAARLLNPSGGTTFHPKLYVARRGRSFAALVGSANLTFGLAGNFEAGVVVDGSVAHDAWVLAEQLWNLPETVPWTPKGRVRPDELDAALYRLLSKHIRAGQTIHTLGRTRMPNTVLAFSRTGATVATTASPGGEHVEPRMIQIGYDALVTSPTGQLTNKHLRVDLRVHRSSFVMALLATLPMVRPVPHPRDVIVELTGRPPVPPSSRNP